MSPRRVTPWLDLRAQCQHPGLAGDVNATGICLTKQKRLAQYLGCSGSVWASGSAGFRGFGDVVSFFSLPILQLCLSLPVSLTLSCCKWPSCPPGAAEKLGTDPDRLPFCVWGWGPDPPGWAASEGPAGALRVGGPCWERCGLMNKERPLQRAQQRGGRLPPGSQGSPRSSG